jgi:ketosteroid isomerase-like protein
MDPQYASSFLATVGTAAAAVSQDVSDPQAVLHTVYAAIVKGDFDAASQSMTEDVELNICGFGPMNGTWRGRTEVVEATRKNFALLAGQQPEVDAMIAQGDCVAVLLRESGVLKSTGQPYSIRGVQWFTFVDGKIRRIDEIVASI